jgi:type I restriction enzyme S subunit
VRFRDLERWDVTFFRGLSWQWPERYIFPLGAILVRKRIEVKHSGDIASIPIIEKISFGGTISITDPDKREGYKGRLFWADPTDLLFSKIRAKQGSLAVIPAKYGRVAVSAEYPVYTVRAEKADPFFVELVLRSKPFLRLLEGLAHGGSSKTRIPPEDFERLTIPVPPLDVQRAIVAHWQRGISEEAEALASAEHIETQLIEHVLIEAGITVHSLNKKPRAYAVSLCDFDRWGVEFNRWAWSIEDLLSSTKHPTARLATVASINPAVSHQLADDDMVSFVPMAAVSDVSGQIVSPEPRPYGEVKSGYTRFSEGDVIWAKITPCMQNGKCAVARDLTNGVGLGSTEFHVVRVKDKDSLLPDYVWLLLRLHRVRDAAQRYFIGSAGQQRVPAQFLEELHIPIPPIELQRDILKRVEAGYHEVARFRATADQAREVVEVEVEAMIIGTMPAPTQ